MLTTTRPSDDVTVDTIEDQKLLPTCDNVVASFKRVLKLAKPRDRVYIHFSGHGTTRNLDGAVALLLLHPSHFRLQCLYGRVLRNAIRTMIEENLAVTLVLDCCFSGKVMRTDHVHGSIRYVKYDSAFDAQSGFEDPFAHNFPGSIRGAEISLQRLLDPDGYTIITACGSDETASEIVFDTGVRMGALSYFLVDSLTTLKKSSLHVSDMTLYQHLRARFHAHYSQQTPMLYGNRGFSFFGDFIVNSNLSIVSVRRNYLDLCLILDAGQVHGVHQDDEYVICPFDTPEDPEIMAGQQAIKAKVDTVDCFTSKLVTIDLRSIDSITKGAAWKAVLVASCSAQKTPICLLSSVPGRGELLEATKQHPYLNLLECDRPIYLAVFIFTQFWEIRNLASKNGDNGYLEMSSGSIGLPVKMKVPDDLQRVGQCQTEDIIKFVITSHQCLFPGSILPRLGVADLRGKSDRLAELLQGLGSGPPGTREDKRHEWTTRTYLIRTHLNQ
ncbi:hypothetical protein F5884DRAFT_821181 [Xylogone sp. PMI_703]|nr:hypothetical protein F5884DRAFT_821181 [Xylogone sp. PMI_703]